MIVSILHCLSSHSLFFQLFSHTEITCQSNPCGAGTCDNFEPGEYRCVCDDEHFGDDCEKGSCITYLISLTSSNFNGFVKYNTCSFETCSSHIESVAF